MKEAVAAILATVQPYLVSGIAAIWDWIKRIVGFLPGLVSNAIVVMARNPSQAVVFVPLFLLAYVSGDVVAREKGHTALRMERANSALAVQTLQAKADSTLNVVKSALQTENAKLIARIADLEKGVAPTSTKASTAAPKKTKAATVKPKSVSLWGG